MATPNAQSVVDFLKQRGFVPEQGERFPLFEQRKRLFGQLGLESESNEFRGTAKENLSLLNRLSESEREAGIGITPQNIVDVTRAQPTQVPPPPSINQQGTATGGTIEAEPTDLVPDRLRGLITQAQGGGGELPTTEEVAGEALERFTGGTEFAFAQEEAQAGKAAVRLTAERETQSFIKSIASRGLFFSGARKEGVSTIEVDKLASLLGIDRKFAKIVATGLQNSAQDLVKEAKAELKTGRDDAKQALGQLGFVLTPEGQLVQKPTEVRAEAAAVRAEEAGVRAETSAERAEIERTKDNSRAILGNEALYNSLSQADKQATWNGAGFSGPAPAKLTGKVQGAEFLDPAFFKRTLTDEQLLEAAIDSGIETKGKSDDVIRNEHLLRLKTIVNEYRLAGFSDNEILKLMR